MASLEKIINKEKKELEEKEQEYNVLDTKGRITSKEMKELEKEYPSLKKIFDSMKI
jgi:hypothetical protein